MESKNSVLVYLFDYRSKSNTIRIIDLEEFKLNLVVNVICERARYDPLAR